MISILNFLLEKFRLELLISVPYSWLYRQLLRHVGKGAYISPFIESKNINCVSLGSHSSICRNTRLIAIKRYGTQSFNPHINIGNNVLVGVGCTLSCVNSIDIGHDVTIGDHVYIADSHHDYSNPKLGIIQQPLLPGKISIGEGAWVGYGAFIAGDISLGEHSIVGANSVVTRSVPAFTVVVGAPAKPIKRYCHESNQWIKISSGSP